jgi:hypothetical protein
MTDRIKGLTVVLESNIRDDDAQPIIDAIKQIRGVVSVATLVQNIDHLMAKEQVKAEIKKNYLIYGGKSNRDNKAKFLCPKFDDMITAEICKDRKVAMPEAGSCDCIFCKHF